MSELKRLAEAATPGPWVVNSAGSAKRGEPFKVTEFYVYAPKVQDDTAICADVIDPVTQEPSEANAAYIAAASPDAILNLLAERDRLREALEDLMAWQVKNVKVWNNSAYDQAAKALGAQ